MHDTATAPAARTERAIHIPALTRAAPVKTWDPETRTVELLWSTGAAVRRYDWWNEEEWIEVLDVSPRAIDLTRLNGGAPLLDSHRTYGLDAVIGVVERAWIDGPDARATVRMSDTETDADIVRKVATGIVRNVSVGYEIDELVDDGRDPDTGLRVMRATRWSPYELSLVPVGADAGAGVRALATNGPEAPARPLRRCRVYLTRSTTEAPLPHPAASATLHQERTMETAAQAAAGPTAADIVVIENQAREAETARVRAISATAEQFVPHVADAAALRAAAAAAIADGTAIHAFQTRVLELVKIHAEKTAHAGRSIGLSQAETARWSITRAIQSMCEKKPDLAGFEWEASRAAAQVLGIEPSHGGILVPHEVQMRSAMRDPASAKYMMARNPLLAQAMQRDLTVGTNADGGFLVATQNDASQFIELLRSRMLMMQLGATYLPGLRDRLTIPRQSAAATAYWLANEATAITESQQTLAQLSLQPRNVGGYTEISKQLMQQSNPAADQLVMNDLQQVLSRAIDLASISGSGSGGQPTGITGTAGIGSVTGTSLAYAGIVEFQTDLATANALDASCAYIAPPAVAGLLKQRQRFSSTDTPLWQGNVLDGSIEGFRASSTTQMAAATLLFGHFAQLVIAEWGAMEIAINPFANFPAGITGVRAWSMVDIGVRQAGAFSLASSIT